MKLESDPVVPVGGGDGAHGSSGLKLGVVKLGRAGGKVSKSIANSGGISTACIF